MAGRSSRNNQGLVELNQSGLRVLQEAIGKGAAEGPAQRNAHGIALGRRGRLKAAKARAEKLSKKRRCEIARKAAKGSSHSRG